MAVEVRIDGSRRLVATLAAAARRLVDFTKPGTAAARTAAARAQAIAPKRTGQLAGSIRASGSRRVGIITASAPHARPVHWGTPRMAARPFLSIAAQGTEGSWIKQYEAHVDDALDTVKGK